MQTKKPEYVNNLHSKRYKNIKDHASLRTRETVTAILPPTVQRCLYIFYNSSHKMITEIKHHILSMVLLLNLFRERGRLAQFSMGKTEPVKRCTKPL